MARALSADAREKMLAAARSLISERGLEGFTVEAVATASGVAKTTIYRHFPSGDDLLLAALASKIDAAPEVDTGSVRDDLSIILHRYMAAAREPRLHQLFTAVLQRAAVDEDFAQLRSTLVCERKQPLRIAIQRGIARGEVDPTIDLDTIASLVEGPMIGRVVHDRAQFRPGEIDQIIDLVLRAVAPRPPS